MYVCMYGPRIGTWASGRSHYTRSFLLDLTLYRQDGKILTHTHFKESALGIHLNVFSAHCPKIHWAWIASEIRRIRSTCSNMVSFRECRATFIRSLINTNYPRSVVDKASKLIPWASSYKTSRLQTNLSRSSLSSLSVWWHERVKGL